MEICKLYELLKIFKTAIINARDDRSFSDDITFYRFPYACCGDTSYLLAEFLREYSIDTLYVWGTASNRQTHAWLVLKDNRVLDPTPSFYEHPDEIKQLLLSYGCDVPDGPIETTKYEETDIVNGIILDLTADQFNQQDIYVGHINHFYKQFRFESAHIHNGFGDNIRLEKLYRIILEHITATITQ